MIAAAACAGSPPGPLLQQSIRSGVVRLGQLLGIRHSLIGSPCTLITSQHQVTQFSALLTRQGLKVAPGRLSVGQLGICSIEQWPIMPNGEPPPKSTANNYQQ